MVNNILNILEPIKNYLPTSENTNNYFLKLLEFIEKYSNIDTSSVRNKIKNSETKNLNNDFEIFLKNLFPFLLSNNENQYKFCNLSDNLEILCKFISISLYDNIPNKNFFENNIKMKYNFNHKYFSKTDFTINSNIILDNKEYIISIYREIYEIDYCEFIDNVERLRKLINDYNEIIENIFKLIEIEIKKEVNDWVFQYDITDIYDIEKYKKQIEFEINEKIYSNEKNKIISLINCIFYEILYMLENLKFK